MSIFRDPYLLLALVVHLIGGLFSLGFGISAAILYKDRRQYIIAILGIIIPFGWAAYWLIAIGFVAAEKANPKSETTSKKQSQ